MSDVGHKFKSLLAKVIPATWLGTLEFHLLPQRGETWGGAFNGQGFRQRLVQDLFNQCSFDYIVETGTFRGSTTLFLAQTASATPIFSSELNPRHFAFASSRLKSHPNVSLHLSDSRDFLKRLPWSSAARVFFYLDAHWNRELPLKEEISLIADRFQSFVIMIDDFEVPDDPGYHFDDYGDGSRLSLRDFPFHLDNRMTTYLPNCSSEQETGAKRGCIILSSLPFAKGLADVRSLRVHELRACTPS